MKKLNTVLLLLLLPFIAYCQNDKIIKQTKDIKITTFGQKEVPEDMIGCGSSFYKSIADRKATKYIGVDDMAKYAFFKIDDRLERYIQTKYSRVGKGYVCIYQNKNKSIQLKIVVKTKKATGDESTFITGSMTVEKSGKKTTIPIVGDVGC